MFKVILLIETSQSYGQGLLRGIAKYSRLHGPWTFYRAGPIPFYREQIESKHLMERLKQWGADGIVTRVASNRVVKDLSLPTVTTDDNEAFHEMPRVISDYKATAYMVAEHLLDRGFQRFAYCGFDNWTWSRERGKHFRERIGKSGLDFFEFKQSTSKKGRLWENEQPALIEWLCGLPKPIGLMACNDDRGQQVIEACQVAGLHIPEEIAVIGVDNDEILCDLTNPLLSSVALSTERAGYEAAQLLDGLMQGRPANERNITVHPLHIVTRQSSDVLAIEDENTVQAIRFIRSHAREPIQVSDIVEATSTSRRILERKFRKTLGRSILSEVKRVRVEQICSLLGDTNLSISEIADSLHFIGIKHLARYFRRETGMSLLEYRKQYGQK